MSTLLDEETATDSLSGLDFAIPCALVTEHDAEVFGRCKRCKGGSFLCRECFEIIRQDAIKRCAMRPTVLFCSYCAAPTSSFDLLFEAVSI